MTAIEFENISKQYKLGLVSTGTLSHDLNRFWQTKILRRPDPYLKIGETNDRASKGSSEYVWALKDINFKVEEGDVVGIIGRNGAGKSTLLKLLSRVTSPTTGAIRARGRIASLLEVGTGFHPEMTGRENIYMNGSIMGMTKAEISRKLDEIVDFSGCERYLDTPVKRYSSGMMVRLGFAVAAHLEPEILVVDEVLAVGDAEFQKKAIGKMNEVAHGQGRTVLFVSHNMRAVRSLCKSGIVLKNGTMDFTGTAAEAIDHYMKLNCLASDQGSIADIKRMDKCNGKMKFTDVKFHNEGGAEEDPRCGRYMKARAFFTVYEEMPRSDISVGISDMSGARIFSMNSQYTGPKMDLTVGDHYIDFIVPRLTLSPGTYLFGVHCANESGLADWLEYALRFTVADDDFYGTGKMVGGNLVGKVVLCDHHWELH